jgi:hypothetical protein
LTPLDVFTDPVEVTATEARMLDRLSLFELKDMQDIKGLAFGTADSRFPPPQNKRADFASDGDFRRWAQNDGHNDAFRHAYWNALMTKRFGADFTARFTTAHEGRADNPGDREAMDLYNNEVGRRIAMENPNASDAELANLVEQAVRDGKLVVIDKSGNLAWSDQVAYGDHGTADDAPAPGVMPAPGDGGPSAS